jgi:hypothetical protein
VAVPPEERDVSEKPIDSPSREEFDDLARRLKHAERMIGALQTHLIDLYCRLGHPYPKNWPTGP